MKFLTAFFIVALFSFNIHANPANNPNHPVFGGEIQPLSCPSGFVAVNSKYCIQENQNGVAPWWEAMTACGELEAKLCSPSEFTFACMKASQLSINGMTDNWEQVDSLTMVSGSNYVRTAVIGGAGTCAIGVTISPAHEARAYRCCYQR